MWGCLANIPGPIAKKAKTMDFIFISYSANSFLVNKSKILKIHVIHDSRDVVFFKDIFPYQMERNKTFGKKHMKRHSGREDPMNLKLMRKLNCHAPLLKIRWSRDATRVSDTYK